MHKKNSVLMVIMIFFLLFVFSKNIFATTYDLYLPEGPYNRGDEFQLTISVDTEGNSIESAEIGSTYDTEFLEFLTVTPGDTFSTVTATPLGGGELMISASNTSGFSGQGTFAYINFKIIASAPGATEICTLWEPSPTTPPGQPTTQPTTPPGQPTTPPQPTPGNEKPFLYIAIGGLLFVLTASGAFAFLNSKRNNS